MPKISETYQPDKVAIKKSTKVFSAIINIASGAIPLIAYTIVPLFFDNFTIIKQKSDGSDTISIPILIYIIITAIISIALLIANYQLSSQDYGIITKKKYDELLSTLDTLDADKEVATEFLNAFNKICYEKMKTLKGIIQNNKKDQINISGQIITSPETQIDKILHDGMVPLLAKFTGISQNHIEVTAAYKFEKETWKWVQNCEPNSQWDVNTLAKNKNSTFYEVISSNTGYVLHNSKIEAANDRHYIFAPDDDEEDGSIIGKCIRIGSFDAPSVIIVLFFSTYNNRNLITKSTKDTDKNVKELKSKLKENFLYEFENRLKIEFSLMFLNEYQYK